MFTDTKTTPAQLDVAVIGAGMSGLCMAITLSRAGINNFRVFEKESDLGGTWRDNTYPGLTCDVPSPYYSYSFEPNPDWSSRFSTNYEIHSYFKKVADKYGINKYIQYGQKLTEAIWSDDHWKLAFEDGTQLSAKALVCATGVLHYPVTPAIEGLESFAGDLFHSGQWDHSVKLEGKRIGVVGTGSTAAQIIGALPDVASHLVQFQRTAQWVLAAPNMRYPKVFKELIRRSDRAAKTSYAFQMKAFDSYSTFVTDDGALRKVASALCKAGLRTVKDKTLRAKLTPDYEPGCKRLIISSTYYPAIQKPNVELVTEGIQRIEPAGIRTNDGKLHEFDVIVMATGFNAQSFMRPVNMVGKEGITIDETWKDGPFGYRSVMVPGYPNMFTILGPHSPVGNTSLIPLSEHQSDFALGWIKKILAGQVASVSPTAEATQTYNDYMSNNMDGTVWTTGCDSWYLGPNGKPMLWPFHPKQYRDSLKKPILSEYEIESKSPVAAEIAS